jgi:hypothetical protein
MDCAFCGQGLSVLVCGRDHVSFITFVFILRPQSDSQAQLEDSHFTQLEEARKARRHISVEGAPFLGYSGPLECFLVLAGLLGMFLLQYLPQAGYLSTMADQYWLYAAGGYSAMVLGHGRCDCSTTIHRHGVRTW